MNDKPDPLEEIRRLRAEQLRVCALQQAADINRLHRAAQATAKPLVAVSSMSGTCGESDAAK